MSDDTFTLARLFAQFTRQQAAIAELQGMLAVNQLVMVANDDARQGIGRVQPIPYTRAHIEDAVKVVMAEAIDPHHFS